MHKVWYISNTQAVTTPGKVMPGWRMANTTGFTIQIPQDWSEYGDGFYEPWCAAPPEYDKEIGIFLNLNLTPGLSLDEMTAGLITDMFGLDDYTIIYTDSVVNPFISTGFGQSGLSSFTAFTFNYNGQEALGVFCYTILSESYMYTNVGGHYFLGLVDNYTWTTKNIFGPMGSTLYISQGSSAEADHDGDGIPDRTDEYPTDPTNQGISTGDGDYDGDGIPDGQDSYPTDPQRY